MPDIDSPPLPSFRSHRAELPQWELAADEQRWDEELLNVNYYLFVYKITNFNCKKAHYYITCNQKELPNQKPSFYYNIMPPCNSRVPSSNFSRISLGTAKTIIQIAHRPSTASDPPLPIDDHPNPARNPSLPPHLRRTPGRFAPNLQLVDIRTFPYILN